ncbi:MAG: formylglycine-generating enzyme family protein [Verrucomicrobiota bacterium]
MTISTIPNQTIVVSLRPLRNLLISLLSCSFGQSLVAGPPLAVGLTMDKGAPELRISGSSGQLIRVEYRTSWLNSTPWQVLTNIQLTQATMSFVDRTTLPVPMRFYRLSASVASPFSPIVFLMGSPATEDGRDFDEGPQTLVTLTKAFSMGQHEVTQGEYLAVMGSNPSAATGDTNRPVEQVSWDDAQSYCLKLTALEVAAGRIPPTSLYRLPTEAEWESAARAGSTNRFSFGDDPDYVHLGEHAWFAANSDGTPHPVATKQSNPSGLYDMAGNVWEWCQDWYGSYPGGTRTDPTGPASGIERVIRGGSYYYDGWLCRSAARNAFRPGTRSPQIGFRVVFASN